MQERGWWLIEGSASCGCGCQFAFEYRLDQKPSPSGAKTMTTRRCPACADYVDIPIFAGGYFVEIHVPPHIRAERAAAEAAQAKAEAQTRPSPIEVRSMEEAIKHIWADLRGLGIRSLIEDLARGRVSCSPSMRNSPQAQLRYVEGIIAEKEALLRTLDAEPYDAADDPRTAIEMHRFREGIADLRSLRRHLLKMSGTEPIH
jgi:hypothetical protein